MNLTVRPPIPRSLLHNDGNIRYVNYQNRDQMTAYLTSNGHAASGRSTGESQKARAADAALF